MVVNDIQDDREPEAVRRVDEPPEGVRIPVAVERSVERYPVIAPVTGAGELRHGHDLQHGHAEIAQCGKLAPGGVEGPLLREGSDVQLVNHLALHPDAGPARVAPVEVGRIHDEGGTVRAAGLEARARIGKRSLPVQPIAV